MPAPAQLFDRYTLPELRKIRNGFDREYDIACLGEPGHKDVDWLLNRMHMLDKLIERKELEPKPLPDVKNVSKKPKYGKAR